MQAAENTEEVQTDALLVAMEEITKAVAECEFDVDGELTSGAKELLSAYEDCDDAMGMEAISDEEDDEDES